MFFLFLSKLSKYTILEIIIQIFVDKPPKNIIPKLKTTHKLIIYESNNKML